MNPQVKLYADMQRRAHLHSYSWEQFPDGKRLVVYEPDVDGGAPVCIIAGDPASEVANMRADAICTALDRQLRLARNQP